MSVPHPASYVICPAVRPTSWSGHCIARCPFLAKWGQSSSFSLPHQFLPVLAVTAASVYRHVRKHLPWSQVTSSCRDGQVWQDVFVRDKVGNCNAERFQQVFIKGVGNFVSISVLINNMFCSAGSLLKSWVSRFVMNVFTETRHWAYLKPVESILHHHARYL